MSNKREKDRESGTGQPIKAIPPKGGAGVGNWGSNSEQIADGVQEAGADDKRKKKKPRNFADLNEQAPDYSGHDTYDDWAKKNMKDQKVGPYQVQTRKSQYKKKYKSNKFEAETDAMFGPVAGKKKKRKKKGKGQKIMLATDVYYGPPEKGTDTERGRGRGRGRGGGRGRGSNLRGGGYRGRGGGGYGGGRGGFGGRGGGYGRGRGGGYGGGFGRGGGFGSRGRGYQSTYSDNQQNMQNPNEYQGGDRGSGAMPMSSNQQQPPMNSNPPPETMNAPISAQ